MEISVLVAVYNVECYLRQCLDSILEQTLSEFEVIIVDDGSTDRSGAIADDYSIKDKRITVIHKENGGLSSARMVGIQAAKGEYVLMVDGDDYLMPNMLEKMYRAISDSVADICVCDWFNDKPFEYHKKEMVVYKKSEFMPPILLDSWPSVTWNKLIRKNCLDGVEFPPKMVAQDIGVMHLIFNNAEKIVAISDKLYVYRDDALLNTNNTTNRNAKRFISSYHRAIHFRNRLEFADIYYPECSDQLLDFVVGFYDASYMKATVENNYSAEKEKIIQYLRDIWPRIERSSEVAFSKKVVSYLIIHSRGIIKVVSKLYVKNRYSG
ncbi:glycosyltransferase family 2 protein [Butyrivibrio fibrisolvens]|uniref:glycosyltransferase family 2 protein n=1 Tax=Butyrivibrio fibrisolvens TaxID=831 RepID=UPI000409A463|nr:glycosyltransferase family 2 protein [Butyrivibrio fibrisolvens]